jgi:hypothetical protein
MKDTDLGIYCVGQKKFYYLETGEVPFPNPIPRLRSTLQQRDLIDFNPRNYMDTSNYLIRTIREAKANDWEMERIFATTHVKKTIKAQEAAAAAEPVASGKSSWGRPAAPTAKKKTARRGKKTVAKVTEQATE